MRNTSIQPSSSNEPVNWVEKRRQELKTYRERIIGLESEQLLDAILDHPQATALVHSFPETDFHILIHEIGLEDSLELLSMASNKQWQYIVDVESWQRDRVDLATATKWMGLLMKCDPDRFVRWVLTDPDMNLFFEFYLYYNMVVVVREHDQDPSELGNDLFTLDDIYYVRFTDMPPDVSLNNPFATPEFRNGFLQAFLHRLADQDHVIYQSLLAEYRSILPAETEEEIYRLRNIRLAEKGFMPSHEAVSIYQPLPPKAVGIKGIKQFPEPDPEFPVPVPMYPTTLLASENLFVRSLVKVEPAEVLFHLQTEFANLCNQIISADKTIIREKDGLKAVVKKACAYISIGLEQLDDTNGSGASSGTHGDDGRDIRNAAVIRKYPLDLIFRVGYGAVMDVKWKAEKWKKSCWFETQGLELSFWGEQWLGVLGGLLIHRPMAYDNYKTGVLYRHFESLEDIRYAADTLDLVMALDKVLERMATTIASLCPPDPPLGGLLTWKNLVLTHWVKHRMGYSNPGYRIPMDVFRKFFNQLWQHPQTPRRIKESEKAEFLEWFCQSTGLQPHEIPDNVAQALTDLFEEIESEYGSVSTSNLDARYIHLFNVE